jgi:hypothetical protein
MPVISASQLSQPHGPREITMQRHVTDIGRLVPAWRILLLPLGLLAGCASRPAVYEKPGVTEAEQKRDQSACVRVALSSGQPAQIGIATVDRDVFAQCMERKGYLLRQK